MRLCRLLVAVTTLGSIVLPADPLKFLRSLSGPSGKAVGTEFVLTETRSRFVYPTDSSLVVYFQWEAPPGAHTLTAVWKQPNGRVASISPDVKIETTTTALNCYWIFSLSPGLANGIWVVEVRVDGQPAGSHPFEIAGMASQQLSLDKIFKSVGPSVVWIHKLDQEQMRIDVAIGFVLGVNAIATAFQAIDSATFLEIEFTTGRKVKTDEVLAFSRTGDWAILKANTGDLPPVDRGDTAEILVGQRLALFNFDSNGRVIGVVDIGGQSIVQGFGGRIQITPEAALEAAGGPLLDSFGHVVGIVGGSIRPGARIDRRASTGNRDVKEMLAHGAGGTVINSATPVSEIPKDLPSETRTLGQLAREGLMTPLLLPIPELIYGGTTTELRKRVSSGLPAESSQFSEQDREIAVFAQWMKKGKLSKGTVSIRIYDASNKIRGMSPAKKIVLRREPQQVDFTFSRASFGPGAYRVDLSWDDRPVWRTFFRIRD